MLTDFLLVFNWWVLLFTLGVISFPLSFLLFRKFFDLGWGFSKILGIALLSYLVFLSGILKTLPFTRLTSFFFLAVLLLVNGWVLAKNWGEIKKSFWQKRKIVVFEEILFLLGLFVWSYIRGNNPAINGLEKFMDFGFINSILRSEYFPPFDMWMAGETINYYWFGHLTVAVLTKLSGIPAEITYNLMVAAIFGLVFVSAFSLSSTLTHAFFKKGAILGGLISATLLTLGANLHTLAWHLFPQLKTCNNFYWYPDATRFIGYCPPTLDKTIHEFPIYSFVVSDLHAHLLNLPFVILFLALLFRLLRRAEAKTISAFLWAVIPPAFILGIMFMTNTWDFATYLMVSGIGLLFGQMGRKMNPGALWEIFKNFILLTVVALLFALPFILNFSSPSSGLGLVHSRTPLWQLLILWGAPLSLTVLFILVLRKRAWVATDKFLAALLASSWVLILLPEIFYVKDIYIQEYYRANTMFKFTYQAFVMFSLAAGYIMVRVINSVRGGVRPVLTLYFLLLTFSLLVYPYFAIRGNYGNLKNFQGLAGDLWLKERYPENWQAIAWFQENVAGQPTILEAPGDSYTDYNQISVYTGLPTVEGWLVHEWLWRGSFDEPGRRASDVERLYTSSSFKETKDLLEKYNVSYVLVGELERQKYPSLDEGKFSVLGEKVFSAGTTAIFRIPTYNASSWLY